MVNADMAGSMEGDPGRQRLSDADWPLPSLIRRDLHFPQLRFNVPFPASQRFVLSVAAVICLGVAVWQSNLVLEPKPGSLLPAALVLGLLLAIGLPSAFMALTGTSVRWYVSEAVLIVRSRSPLGSGQAYYTARDIVRLAIRTGRVVWGEPEGFYVLIELNTGQTLRSETVDSPTHAERIEADLRQALYM